jgi:hypothetical protein
MTKSTKQRRRQLKMGTSRSKTHRTVTTVGAVVPVVAQVVPVSVMGNR